MHQLKLHGFEAGRRGKPDRLESDIAQLLGAAILERDPKARFDLRVNGSFTQRHPVLLLGGEIASDDSVSRWNEPLDAVARNHYLAVHKLSSSPLAIQHFYKGQARELRGNEEAGDSGVAIAVAFRDTPNHLPMERFVAVELRDFFDAVYAGEGVPEGVRRNTSVYGVRGLRADGKIDVRAIYEGPDLKYLHRIVIALQHDRYAPVEEVRRDVQTLVKARLNQISQSTGKNLGEPEVLVNTRGPFVTGGWEADAGSREAKPYSDVFGSYGCLEDSIAGEDPSKPSGTGAYGARFLAVQIVSGCEVDFAEVRLEYEIGSRHVGVHVTTHGDREEQKRIERFVDSLHLDLRIPALIERFGLRDPVWYRRTATDSDFFHHPELPWNQVMHHLR